MRSLRIAFAVVVGSVLLCSPVCGDLYLSVDQLSYAVSPGQSIEVPVYLYATLAHVPLLLSVAHGGEGGLDTGDFLVARTDDGDGQPATITDASADGTGFDLWGPLPDLSPDGDWASLYLMSSAGAVGTEMPTGSGIYRVVLGTFTFTGGAVGNMSVFEVKDDSDDDWLTWERSWDEFSPFYGVFLDATPIYTSVPFTVSTVPLPSAVLLCVGGMSVSGALLRRRGVRHSRAAA